MVEIGKTNHLTVVKEVDFGIYLDGGDMGEILLPTRYVPKKYKVGEPLEVFIYRDSEDRVIATTLKAHAEVGQFALMKVDSMSRFGAFLDWGLPKQLLVPFREQSQKMEEGRSYIVRVYLDRETGRVAASSKLDQFLNKIPADYQPNDPVQLIIAGPTDMGFKVIINERHWGMLFKEDVFQTLDRGQHIDGFIKQVRHDGKIDVVLHRQGYEKVDDLSKKILDQLKSHGGFIPVTDKSSPDMISRLFGVSKKTYKKAAGSLYKRHIIDLKENGIYLLEKTKKK
jgi:predicted RNA-binding protein (virulence factor B family)